MKGISMKSFIILIISLLIMNEIEAKPVLSMTGGDLKTICTATDVGRCLSYINGVNDGFYVMANMSQNQETATGPVNLPYCVPSNLPPDYLIKVILNYLDSYPYATQKNGALLIYGAFMQNFPCH